MTQFSFLSSGPLPDGPIALCREFFLRAADEHLPPGRYELQRGIYVMIQEYETKTPQTFYWEAHNIYADLQAMFSGEEMIAVADRSRLTLHKADAEHDLYWYAGSGETACELYAGDVLLLLPNDAHRPCQPGKNGVKAVKKAVFKIPADQV